MKKVFAALKNTVGVFDSIDRLYESNPLVIEYRKQVCENGQLTWIGHEVDKKNMRGDFLRVAVDMRKATDEAKRLMC
jgi:hypothetical protein